MLDPRWPQLPLNVDEFDSNLIIFLVFFADEYCNSLKSIYQCDELQTTV